MDADGTASALVAMCADTSASEGDSWTCPAPITVECSEHAQLPLSVASPEGQTCNASDLRVSQDPLTPGVHNVAVQNVSGATLCTTEITVTDKTAPTIETHTIQLWPPNHKFHDIAVEDCVSAHDACAGDLEGEFMWASSDEPVDDLGDGHHSPDIMLGADCKHVSVRSERQGPKDGRIYKLGVRVMDGSGNMTDAVCSVIVDHDQRGVVGADSGEAYRVTFDGSHGGPACDGTPDQPPAPPPVTPPSTPLATPPMTPPPPADNPPASSTPSQPD